MKAGRIFVSVMLLVLMSMLIIGCDNEPKEKVTAVMVVGKHSNAGKIPFESEALNSILYEAAYSHGEVAFITSEGSPKVFYRTSIPEPTTKGLSKEKQEAIAKRYTEELKLIINEATPESEEVNTLKSIAFAADILSGAEGRKILCISDTGIQTTGYLDLRKGLLDAEPEDIVKALEAENALPDLSDADVNWYLMGQTAKPQKPLSAYQMGRLKEMWKQILTACGANSVNIIDSVQASNKSYRDLPHVSVIDVEKENISVEAGKKKKKVAVKKMVLDSNELKFEGDKAEFTDIDEAKQVLSALGETLLESKKTEIIIIGTTAGGKSKEFSQRLSTERANAVKAVLISMGVKEDRMKAIGLADKDPWHIPDLDETGHQIENKAAQNRKVVILDANDDEAGQFK